MIKTEDTTIVTEQERMAAEAVIAERMGPDVKIVSGSSGNSPYAENTVVFFNTWAGERGDRIALRYVCQSHNGAGRYKGRGRWRAVYIAVGKADGDLAVCTASDRDAEEVGSSGFFVRPWATHEAEQASRGLGLAQEAVASAFAAVGL